MKSFFFFLLLSPLLTNTSFAQYTSDKFSGEIYFTDGEIIRYNYLMGTSGDKTSYTKDINEPATRTILLSSVAKIDFLPFTKEEQGKTKKGYVSEIRKAKITFNNGEIYDAIYLSCYIRWQSPNEEGILCNKTIKRLTVNHSK